MNKEEHLLDNGNMTSENSKDFKTIRMNYGKDGNK